MSELKLSWLGRSSGICCMLVMLFAAPIARAHLMVAQQGTLNFLDNNVFMVLSLPASAFDTADENSDGLLSLEEFSKHRLDIIDIASSQVSLSNKKMKLPMNDIMVSPVTPHNAPKDPADQLIVMARFSLPEKIDTLLFQVDIFGKSTEEQSIKIKAARKSEEMSQSFSLSPEKNIAMLEFK